MLSYNVVHNEARYNRWRVAVVNKLARIVLALVMAAGVTFAVTGCGGSTEKPDTGAETNVAPPEGNVGAETPETKSGEGVGELPVVDPSQTPGQASARR